MVSYSREVLRDLIDGRLPWPQTRRIMSAYKDEDRFFKIIAILQERVRWKDRILLPISDHLFIVQHGKRRVTKCECGKSFGDYRRNWKLRANVRIRTLPGPCARSIPAVTSLTRAGWRSANSFVRDVALCMKSRHARPAIPSSMILSPTSSVSIAIGSTGHWTDA
jgi:acetone carboxylase gamma subunit